jgi:molecular chaperone DnaK (HSP70)
MSRYLVGIDLGTTHTVVAYADSESLSEPIQVFHIDQLVAPGEVAARPLLASMRYHPAAGELRDTERLLPWQPDASEDPVPEAIVGALAQELGCKAPGRLVSSAKSWLSHPGVDRSAPILPWGAAPDVPSISPLEASAGYLRHVRHAWNHRFPHDRLQSQEIVLTVPASFDEVARRLTVEAAHLAGLPQVRLVEEPQAACYDWLARHAEALEDALAGICNLLVCDVGGGTSDFTLIRVEHRGRQPELVRIGVGEHLMLGGDNMDLALAQVAERRLLSAGNRLSAAQLSQLVQQCRGAKERLLVQEAPKTASVTLLGAGARLVGHARSTELSRDEVRGLVVDGFFPKAAPHERPQRRRAGIVELGLPYAADPSITRHLAAFLADHAGSLRVDAADPTSSESTLPIPDAVLLNGGVFHSTALSNRLLEVLGTWRGEAPLLLHNEHPDLAVARGAVAYALARRGQGLRIGGGSARSFLLLVEGKESQAQRAICLLPRGAEEDRELRLTERLFSLRLGQPVGFRLVSGTSDRSYSPGELVDIDQEHFRPLPPLATVLAGPAAADARAHEVSVQLAAMITDIGTLEMDCVATESSPTDPEQRWRLEFQLRDQGLQAASAPSKLPADFSQAADRIKRIYGARIVGVGPKESKTLLRDLEKLLGPRDTWDTHVLRELFGVIWDGARRRRRTADHERLWLNLAGFCLRPGYGYPLDDWRLHQLWSIYAQGLQYKEEARNRAEWWTLWRRVAGGLNQDQQLRILKDIDSQLRQAGSRVRRSAKTIAIDDIVRLAAGLERLPSEHKARLGEQMLRERKKPIDYSPQRWWALGRLGARVPLYGSVHDVIPRDLAQAWLEQLLRIDWRTLEPAAFAAAQLARMSGDRQRDLDPALRERVGERLRKEKAPEKWITMVEEVIQIDRSEESLIFGESLPPGLRLVS